LLRRGGVARFNFVGKTGKYIIMKQAIFRNWNFIRVLRLAMGIAIVVQGVMAKEVLFGIAGILFTGMAVFNMGCCAAGNCAAPPVKDKSVSKEIQYEEVV